MSTASRPRPVPADDLHPGDAAVLLEQQLDVLDLVASAAPLNEVLGAVIVALEDLMPAARCSILVVDPVDGTLRHGAAPSLPHAYLRVIDGLVPGPDAGSCGSAAYLGRPVVVPDLRVDHRWTGFRGIAGRSGLVACWSTPISTAREGVVGTFAVYHGHPHEPSERERRLVDRFTHLASVAIEHSRLLGDVIESEELFRRSFEDNPAGEVLCDLDRRVERVNRAFCALSGFDADDLIGVPIDTVVEIDIGTAEHIRAALACGASSVTRQSTLTSGSGAGRPVEITFSVIRDRSGSPARLALNVIDLTARLAAEADRQARREAEVARQIAVDHSTAKSALLTSVSHEIRTPLQAIKGFTELLSTLDLDRHRRSEALTRINTAADHLLSLVTDVLDLSRAEAKALPLRPASVEVRAGVIEVVELTSALAEARGVSVTSRLAAGDRVRADPDRLRQVLLNLIGNAISHGRRGGTVHISAVATTSTVTLEITDDGPGIPEEFLDRIFTPFARAADSGGADAVDGNGLGLMLAHGLVTAMDGELLAGNTDRGAVFTLRLPRD